MTTIHELEKELKNLTKIYRTTTSTITRKNTKKEMDKITKKINKIKGVILNDL
jgi:flagellin-specific chaperone FliS